MSFHVKLTTLIPVTEHGALMPNADVYVICPKSERINSLWQIIVLLKSA